MNKLWQILLFCCMLSGFYSCQQKVVCPAFQSAFIFQDDVRTKRFSMFGEDTLPKAYTPYKKLKYGIKEPESYKSTVKSMATVDMKLVFPKKGEVDSLVYAELNFVRNDSMFADYAEAEVDIFYRTMRKGNLDQMFYNGLYGDQLKKPEESLNSEKEADEDAVLKEVKKWWDFLKPKKDEKKEEKVVPENPGAEEEEDDKNPYLDDFKKEDFW